MLESLGTNRVVSSAYFASLLDPDLAFKSLAMTTYNIEPMPDPCTILALIAAYGAVADNTGLSSFVEQLLPPKSAKSLEILQKFEL